MRIGFALFDNVTQLDLTGPAQVLARLPGAEMIYAAADNAPVATDCGFAIQPTTTREACPPLDILCVPGGYGVAPAMADPAWIGFVTRQAETARYVTSVCTGAFILGAAGLLQGRRATTHWAYHDLLALFGAHPVPDRVVRDGVLITGGGVTAGIDFALTLAAEIAGRDTAEMIAMALEYDPAPPFGAGSPPAAPEIAAGLKAGPFSERREVMAEASRAALARLG
jgi:cyclohexyl-isocyanide hydratase